MIDYAPPHDHPRPPRVRRAALALAAEVARCEPDLAVTIAGFTEQRFGFTALLVLTHAQGGRGTFELCETWGETFVQDFHDVPDLAIGRMIALWAAIEREHDNAIVAGVGAPC